MKAFRYLASHWIDTLLDRRFKLAKPSDLNDPFDCVLGYKGKPNRSFVLAAAKDYLNSLSSKKINRSEVNQVANKMQRELIEYVSDFAQHKHGADQSVRLLCMSVAKEQNEQTLKYRQSEILMWSHYTKNHAGLRIGIDLSNFTDDQVEILPVTYSTKRPLCNLSRGLGTDPSSVVRLVVTTKSKAWTYEDEIRLIKTRENHKEESSDDGQNLSFLEFDPKAVWRVDFGLHMPLKQQRTCLALLKKHYPHVEAYKACYHKNQYCLEYIPLKFNT